MSDNLDELDPPLLEPEAHEEAENEAYEGENEAEGQGGENDGSENVGQGQDDRRQVGPPKVSRENNAVRAARERAQAAEAKAAALEQVINQYRQAPPDPAAAAYAHQQEQERLAMMAPHEATQYLLEKQARQTQQQIAGLQRQQADALDQIAFQSLTASNPVAAKFSSRVEALVREQAANGFVVKREQALKYAIGEAVLAKAPAAARKQAAQAGARVAGATTRPAAGGGDASVDRRAAGNSLAALEKRLAGKFI